MIRWKDKVKQIPARVQVASDVVYEIAWVDSFPDPKIMGETRFLEKQIVIKNNMTAKDTFITYLHELFHAISDKYQVNLTENQILALEGVFPYLTKKDNVLLQPVKERKRRKKRT
jgi:hypothetical protein